MSDALLIDGSEGEGGGQILSTSLSLSVITGPARPHLQHPCEPGEAGIATSAPGGGPRGGGDLECRLVGRRRHSRDLTFTPNAVRGGTYHFDVGSAGSTMLVLQTVLPPLMIADLPSTITLAGGTHNFGRRRSRSSRRRSSRSSTAWAPASKPSSTVMASPPRAAACATVRTEPTRTLTPLNLDRRGPVKRILAKATVAGLPATIARGRARRHGRRSQTVVSPDEGGGTAAGGGTGNIVTIEIESADVTEIVTAFGQRGVPAEKARGAAEEARRYLATDAAVGEHLADQLMIPLASRAAGRTERGCFRCIRLRILRRLGSSWTRRFGRLSRPTGPAS